MTANEVRSLLWILLTLPILTLHAHAWYTAKRDIWALKTRKIDGLLQTIASSAIRRERIAFNGQCLMLLAGIVALFIPSSNNSQGSVWARSLVIVFLYTFQLLVCLNSYLDYRSRKKALTRYGVSKKEAHARRRRLLIIFRRRRDGDV